MNMDLAQSSTLNMDPHGPTITSPHMIKPRPRRCSHSRRPGVMAHHRMTSLLPFLHRSATCFSSFLSDHQEDLHRTLPGNPPRFYQGNPGDSPRVMILVELMTLVLCTKSIGQWPFTLVDGTLEYL
jgi:hypothetical protein